MADAPAAAGSRSGWVGNYSPAGIKK